MNTLLRIVCVLFGVLILAQALALWNATGRELFTAYPNKERAQMQKYDAAAAALFPPEEGEDPAQNVTTNDFYFGLFPSGLDKHAASVASIGGPALAMTLAALLLRTKPRTRRVASVNV